MALFCSALSACDGSADAGSLRPNPTSDSGAAPADATNGPDVGDAANPPDGAVAVPPGCGNNVLDMGEACDGAALGGNTCASLPGWQSGTLGCKSDCSGYDVSGCAKGKTVTAASCSEGDVAAAVSSAGDGDVVSIPAGNCTWTTHVKIAKGITLQGSGQDATVITASATLLLSVMGDGAGFRLTGIGFAGTVPQWGALFAVDGNIPNLRIDHAKFTDVHAVTATSHIFLFGLNTVYTSVPAIKGVIDHVTFHAQNPSSMYLLYGKSEAWLAPDDPGTQNALYVEDSALTWSQPFSSQNSVSDGEHGARFVVRHNSVTNGTILWHDTGSTPQSRGTRLYEIYGNAFACTVADCGWVSMTLRGGTGVIYANTIPMGSNGYENASETEIFRVTQAGGVPWNSKCDGTTYRICSDFRSHCSGGAHQGCVDAYDCTSTNSGTCSVNACTQDGDCGSGATCLAQLDGQQDSTGWPCRDQTGRGQDDPVTHVQASSPSYWWGNQSTANHTIKPGVAGFDAPYIKQDRDYYWDEPGSDGSKGVGVGTKASMPVTCTTGAGYWATDENKLYRCTANAWSERYVAYPYPHPLTQL